MGWQDDRDDDWESTSFDDDEPTRPCPYCGKAIHEESQRCPYCETYISQEDAPTARKPVWFYVVVILCVMFALGWFIGF